MNNFYFRGSSSSVEQSKIKMQSEPGSQVQARAVSNRNPYGASYPVPSPLSQDYSSITYTSASDLYSPRSLTSQVSDPTRYPSSAYSLSLRYPYNASYPVPFPLSQVNSSITYPSASDYLYSSRFPTSQVSDPASFRFSLNQLENFGNHQQTMSVMQSENQKMEKTLALLKRDLKEAQKKLIEVDNRQKAEAGVQTLNSYNETDKHLQTMKAIIADLKHNLLEAQRNFDKEVDNRKKAEAKVQELQSHIETDKNIRFQISNENQQLNDKVSNLEKQLQGLGEKMKVESESYLKLKNSMDELLQKISCKDNKIQTLNEDIALQKGFIKLREDAIDRLSEQLEQTRKSLSQASDRSQSTLSQASERSQTKRCLGCEAENEGQKRHKSLRL